MTEISRFLGIVIGMFYSEHGVPHFHAVYGEHEISVEIESGPFTAIFRREPIGSYLSGRRFTGKNCSKTGTRGPAAEANPAPGVIMNYHVVEARYVGGHVIWLRFRDGTSGELDLWSALRGPVFEPLRDPAMSSQFQIDPEFHTLVRPNGADFAPEYLHDRVKVTA